MSLAATYPAAGSALGYRRARGMTPARRALAWGAVAALHAALVAALALVGVRSEAPPPAPTIMVSMLPQAAPVAAPAEPEPPPPQPTPAEPTPQPKMIAASRPTASPMTAPPPDEPVRPAPSQASSAPASPSPPAPSAAPSGPTTPPNFTAAYLNNPGPQYPYASRRKREQGLVKLRVFVSAAGRPEQVEIERSSGFPLLDQAAQDVVKTRWRFAPAKQGDKAIGAWVVVPLEFELKDR